MQCWKTRSGAYAGSVWENPDRSSARNYPIRFKDLGFRTAEILKKKINICYLAAGRSVLGKTVPEVLSTQDQGHSFSQYGPT